MAYLTLVNQELVREQLNLTDLVHARVPGILGSGVQARSHLEGKRLVCDIDEVRVWSPQNAAKFAAQHNATAATSAEACVRGADIVCVVTGSETPVLKGEWLTPGM